MPPKKKLKETTASTEIFLLGQPSATPVSMTKPLTNGDMLRYLHYRKNMEKKSSSWESLSSCPLITGKAEAGCSVKGCQVVGGEDQCEVAFAKHTGGWLKTASSLKTDKTVKVHIMKIFKLWQDMNKQSSRLCKDNLSTKQIDLVESFKIKMNSTFLITDDNA